MDEKIPEVPVVDEVQTTIAFGKAEPGRDIFAGEPVKEIKSDHTTLAAPAEEKEISSVFSQSSMGAMLVDAEKKDESANSAASSTPERAASLSEEAEVRIQTHPATASNSDEQTVQKQPQGPLDEPAAEANRAAQELYPDAHGEK